MLSYLSLLGFIGLMINPAKASPSHETAIFSGGCFWCEEEVFNHLPGVLSVTVGYTGGHTSNPTYEQVSHENTGHKEAVQIIFDLAKITYDDLLTTYWHNIDPFDGKGQFCDKGDSYRAVIFYTNETQRGKAEASKKKIEEHFQQPISTEIQPAFPFYLAEDYHQHYAEKNPLRYKFYRYTCGRDQRLAQVWEKS
jgi:peptide-methionine (S)-S-oxide reductase